MNDRPILLVEDSADDVELTTIALAEAKITNPVVVASNGVAASTTCWAWEPMPGGTRRSSRSWSCSTSKLPLLSGIDVLRRMRETSAPGAPRS